MRMVPLLLVLAACGRLGPFTEFREDTGDTADIADTGADTALDTDTAVDTDIDSDVDSDPPDLREGVYVGTFEMEITLAGFLPVDSCTGDAQIYVTATSVTGEFQCPFATLGAQSGELTATLTGATVVDPYATLGATFVFDELSGAFQGTTALTLTETGVVPTGDIPWNYAVVFDVRK